MKKFIYLVALLGLSSASVQATTVFNFAAYADNNLAGSTSVTGLGESAYASFSATNNGVTVTATGTDANGAAYAYLDSGKAGLGVCSTPDNANQCDPSNDDNVTGGESVKLDFGWEVSLDSLGLVDAKHGTSLFNGNFDIKVDGVLLAMSTALSGSPASIVGLTGTTFEFINLVGDQGSEFYINNIGVSTVPVPAAGILFASALFGAGALGRRKKKAKASVVGAFARAS